MELPFSSLFLADCLQDLVLSIPLAKDRKNG
jgi:hypothetical protein